MYRKARECVPRRYHSQVLKSRSMLQIFFYNNVRKLKSPALYTRFLCFELIFRMFLNYIKYKIIFRWDIRKIRRKI